MNGWRPLLDGRLAERAWETVESIAQVIKPAAAPLAPLPDQDGDELARLAHQEQHPNVAGGVAGRAMFFAYLSKAGQGREEDGEIAAALLEKATDALSTVPLTPDLYGGFAGVAWAAEHLYSPRFVAADAGAASASTAGIEGAAAALEADPLVEIDEALQSFLDHTPWTADYDLIRGLTGFGVYALERLPQPSALACLAMVVDRLGETAERGPQGITWHTAPELLPDWQRELFPKGYYNLGVAHGMPGTIAMLAAASAAAESMAGGTAGGKMHHGLADLAPLAKSTAQRARDLVHGAVQWLQAQRLPADDQAWFGSSFSREIKPTKSRLAWCYGDPGIAASLLVAARACREPAWESYAIELGLHAAARPVATAMVRDAGLCHGSAGLGHLFNRLYQETGEAGFATASRSWFSEALDFRQPGLGLAGYRAFSVGDDKTTTVWRSDSGFLEGVAGIGLALLGGLSDFEPAWDRFLLLSAGDLD
jgi:lantibiotic biosynthesis protein